MIYIYWMNVKWLISVRSIIDIGLMNIRWMFDIFRCPFDQFSISIWWILDLGSISVWPPFDQNEKDLCLLGYEYSLVETNVQCFLDNVRWKFNVRWSIFDLHSIYLRSPFDLNHHVIVKFKQWQKDENIKFTTWFDSDLIMALV